MTHAWTEPPLALGAVLLGITDGLDSGLVVGGVGLLAFLFRQWFVENRRNNSQRWEIADEYRLERDYERLVSARWQALYLHAIGQPVAIPEAPNLERMREDYQPQRAVSDKEDRRAR